MVRIGLEIHVQLNTRTKLFCSCKNEASKKPNVNTCPICLGMPGSKPLINEEAIKKAIKIGLMLNLNFSKKMFFSRKSYFYPDLSKNYQITQYELPVGTQGYFLINVKGRIKKIRIRRIHIEEDPAQIIHVGGSITNAEYVLLDYNRSGVPLCEIVTEPDFESSEEVIIFMKKLLSYLQHIKVFDIRKCKWRCDVNVSIPKGNRSEIKNVGSFKGIKSAINYEIIRQESLINKGFEVKRETRHFNASTNTTELLRTKEEEIDYGYIFEPDLTSFELSSYIKDSEDNMPELPEEIIKRLIKEYRISKNNAEILVQKDPLFVKFFEKCSKMYENKKKLSNWIVGDLFKCLNFQEKSLFESKIKPNDFVDFLNLMDSKKITERLGKELIKEYVEKGIPPRQLINKKNLNLLSKKEILNVIEKVVKENPKSVKDYQEGKEIVIDFLIGEVMKKTRATADPKITRELLEKKLKNK